MNGDPNVPPGLFSIAERAGMVAFVTAALLALINPALATVPLTLFILLCAVMPFFSTLGFFLPVISRGPAARKYVALTFDDGPDPVTTPMLLNLLALHRTPATFFITGRKAIQHPELIRAILDHGHTLGNHSYNHDNCIMFKNSALLRQEIVATQQVLQRFGITPRVFRPPVGITNPRLARALKGTQLYVVNFNRRAMDRGNRRIAHLSRRILKHLRPGDIIMLHDTRPKNRRLITHWRAEVDRILGGIEARGLTVIPLAELIQRPVMDGQQRDAIQAVKHNGSPVFD